MDNLLIFISSSENRDILTWIGSGLVALSSGLWIVMQFFINKNKTSSLPPNSNENTKIINNSINANKNTIAIGSGAKINDSKINIGFGMRAVIIIAVVIGIFFILSSFILDKLFKSTIAAEIIPEVNLVLSCGPTVDENNPYLLTGNEATNFSNFIDSMEKYKGKPIILTVEILKKCGGCECPRAEKHLNLINKNNIDENSAEMFIDHTPPEDRLILADEYRNYHQIEVVGPKFGVAYVAFIPRYEDIPANGLYTRGQYGTFIKYSGPFVPQIVPWTGSFSVIFEPLSVIRPSVLKQIECQRDFRTLNKFSLLLKGCKI